jgi:hypothetical protein
MTTPHSRHHTAFYNEAMGWFLSLYRKVRCGRVVWCGFDYPQSQRQRPRIPRCSAIHHRSCLIGQVDRQVGTSSAVGRRMRPHHRPDLLALSPASPLLPTMLPTRCAGMPALVGARLITNALPAPRCRCDRRRDMREGPWVPFGRGVPPGEKSRLVIRRRLPRLSRRAPEFLGRSFSKLSLPDTPGLPMCGGRDEG